MSSINFLLLASSSPSTPANLAEYTPGAPSRQSTSRPESSASTIASLCSGIVAATLAISVALITTLSAKATSATSATYSSTSNYAKNSAKASSATSATYSSTANYAKIISSEFTDRIDNLEDAVGDLRFGIDSSGNYGYIKVGADTVTPFRSSTIFSGNFFYNCGQLLGKRVVNGTDTLTSEFYIKKYFYYSDKTYIYLSHSIPFQNRNTITIEYTFKISESDYSGNTYARYYIGIASSNNDYNTYLENMYAYEQWGAYSKSGKSSTYTVTYDLSSTTGDLYLLLTMYTRKDGEGSNPYAQLTVNSITFS